MQGQIAHAADAWTFGFGFLRSDHSSLTPSNLSIILINTYKISLIKNIFAFILFRTYEMLSESCAHCAKALHVLTSNWLFVPVSKLTSGETPPDFLIEARLSGSWAHSANAPTVFIKTFLKIKLIFILLRVYLV